MTTEFLEQAFIAFLKRKEHDFLFKKKFLFHCESDILFVNKGIIKEFELKVSESDFRADQRKTSRHKLGKPPYFYYVVPDVSVIKGDFRQYAGIVLHKFAKDGCNLFKTIREPSIIRDIAITYEELYTLLRKVYYNKV